MSSSSNSVIVITIEADSQGALKALKILSLLLSPNLLPTITYGLLGLVIERSSNIVSLFKELENIRIDAWFVYRKDGVKLKYRRGA
jgi:hypothetical protein